VRLHGSTRVGPVGGRHRLKSRLQMKPLIVSLLALSVSGLAYGQTVVYGSGAPNQSTIWYADASYAPATLAAAEFTLTGGASINQLSWWGGFTQPNAASANDSFSMSLYSGAGGTVGSLIATVNLGNAGESATGALIQLSPEYAYNASFASIALGSGTYFLALQRTGGSGTGTWGWESANATAQSVEGYGNSAGAWAYNAGVNLAFSLGGTLSPVPEAATSLMLLLGLPIAGLLGRRRRRA
jgi:hypothetical protein